jgi:5-methylcytosine-specific restriction enzyme A
MPKAEKALTILLVKTIQRTIKNDCQWVKPSPGRLGPIGEGEYVQECGFGHEDWNFNQTLTIKGHIYGYSYYQPSAQKAEDEFNIIFTTYSNHRWYVVGFYFHAKFIEEPPISRSIIERKRVDLLELGDSLGPHWSRLSKEKMLKKLEKETQSLHWKVLPTDAVRTTKPIAIPVKLFHSSNYRITAPTEIDKRKFDAIFALTQNNDLQEEAVIESEFPEGREIERLHKQRERNAMVVTIAKRDFLEKEGRLYCQICEFDFKKKYGELGDGFIEAHHTIPISNRTRKLRTKPSDIAVVCPNCHRMLHRRRPWLSMTDLKKLIVK